MLTLLPIKSSTVSLVVVVFMVFPTLAISSFLAIFLFGFLFSIHPAVAQEMEKLENVPSTLFPHERSPLDFERNNLKTEKDSITRSVYIFNGDCGIEQEIVRGSSEDMACRTRYGELFTRINDWNTEAQKFNCHMSVITETYKEENCRSVHQKAAEFSNAFETWQEEFKTLLEMEEVLGEYERIGTGFAPYEAQSDKVTELAKEARTLISELRIQVKPENGLVEECFGTQLLKEQGECVLGIYKQIFPQPPLLEKKGGPR